MDTPSTVPAPAAAPSSVPAGAIAALQAVLAAENAAIYGYGVAGALLHGSQLATAQQYWDEHRAAAATLAGTLRRLGARPRPAADAYRLPFQVRDAGQAVSLAGYLEDGVTRGYLGVVAVDDTTLRLFAAHAMQACAARAAFWRGHTVAFPGLPASALRSGRTAADAATSSR